MEHQDKPKKLAYSIKEACKATTLGRTTIHNHIAAGRLRANRVGGRILIPVESLRDLVNGKSSQNE